MRSKYKSWQNERSNWTRRIVWLQEKDVSIHLKIEEAEYGIFHIFLSWDEKHIADAIWEMFKEGKSIPALKEMKTNKKVYKMTKEEKNNKAYDDVLDCCGPSMPNDPEYMECYYSWFPLGAEAAGYGEE